MTKPPWKPGEDAAEWGRRTGRFTAARVAFWRQQLTEERDELLAAGARHTGLTAVEETIISLVPALASRIMRDLDDDDAPDDEYTRLYAQAGPPDPGPDEDYNHLYPTREARHAQQDAAVRAGARSNNPHTARAVELTEAEYLAVFGRD